jgi:MFS family permease
LVPEGIMTADPRLLIAREPMQGWQILGVATATACAAAEGFDVYSVSFASPGIAVAWQIDRAVLGAVLSMELVGMGIGALVLGALADRVGRRPTVLACLVMMASGMWLASLAGGVGTLAVVRLYTGLGIGGLLATSSAVVAEYTNDRRRSLAITLMIGGYSLGAVVGGVVASALLAEEARWQAVFELGALATAALIVPALLFLPESIAFLCQRQPKRALSRVNQLLARQGRPPIARLPERLELDSGAGSRALFGPVLRGTTLALTLAFFAYMLTLYFLMKWIPKLVVDMGHPASEAARVLVWANAAGIAGTLAMSVLGQSYDMRRLVMGALVASGAAVFAFGQSSAALASLTAIAAAAAFFVNAANSGFYSIVAQSFPSQLRAGGTGFVIGAGRAGSALGPLIAGILFQAGWSLGLVASVMACGCLVAALSLGRLRPPARSFM